jgi:hypothetical protein
MSSPCILEVCRCVGVIPVVATSERRILAVPKYSILPHATTAINVNSDTWKGMYVAGPGVFLLSVSSQSKYSMLMFKEIVTPALKYEQPLGL